MKKAFFTSHLPLVDEVLEEIDFKECDNIFIFGVQHLAYTTAYMFNALVARGFPAKNIFLHGKCYSSNPYAVKVLKDLGITVADSSFNFDSHFEYDELFPILLENFFSPLLSKCRGKKIILDDGAELLKLVRALKLDTNIVAIEQTSAGYHRALAQNFSFPVINVARAHSKLFQESQFITRMISRKIIECIKSYIPNQISCGILIIGGGAIGQGIYSYLSPVYNVDIFDLNPDLSDIPLESLDHKLSDYNVIIGCTGNCSIQHNKHALLASGALLISASSSDREFDSVYVRRKVPVYYNCHTTFEKDGITLVNSGFPVNFDSSFLDSTEFQLTRALLISAIDQAINFSDNSVIDKFVPLSKAEYIGDRYKDMTSSLDQIERCEIEF